MHRIYIYIHRFFLVLDIYIYNFISSPPVDLVDEGHVHFQAVFILLLFLAQLYEIGFALQLLDYFILAIVTIGVHFQVPTSPTASSP